MNTLGDFDEIALDLNNANTNGDKWGYLRHYMKIRFDSLKGYNLTTKSVIVNISASTAFTYRDGSFCRKVKLSSFQYDFMEKEKYIVIGTGTRVYTEYT